MIPFSYKIKPIKMSLLVWSEGLVLLAFVCATGSFSLRMPTKYANGCYGVGIPGQDYLNPDCKVNEKIAIGYFRVGSKLRTSGCNNTSISRVVADPQTCCTYNDSSPTDKYCFFDYTHGHSTKAHSAKPVDYWASICVGYSRCWSPNDTLGIRVEWVSTSNMCDTDNNGFYDSTHYATAEYYCIADAKRLPDEFAPTETRTADSVVLSSSDYQVRGQTIIAEDTCSLNVVCGDVIVVTLLDVRLNESTSQHITILDGAQTSTIDYHQNTLFVMSNAFYQSNSNFMRVEVRNPDTLEGKFAIVFESLSGNDVTISCGSSALTSYPECLTTTPKTGGNGTSPPQTGASASAQKGDRDQQITFKILFGVFFSLFLICVILFVGRRVWTKEWWPRRYNKVDDTAVVVAGCPPVDTTI